MKLFTPRRRTALLGLSLDGDHLEGVVVRAGSGSAMEVRNAFSVALSLNPLTADVQLVGREIRQHLDQAGVRVRACALCVPAQWALSLQVKLPDLPEADLASFLQLEAERGFPYAPEALMMGQSRFRTPEGEAFATLVAIPREHIDRLVAALAAAQLETVVISLGITALQPPDASDAEGVMSLVPGSQGLTLQVTGGGGVAMLRSIEGVYETIGSNQQLQPEVLFRELRITLAQLPSGVRESVRSIRVFGRGDSAEELQEELQLRTGSWNTRVERISEYRSDADPLSVPSGTPISPALSLAARALGGQSVAFNFLPPRVTVWEQFATRYSSRKLLWTGVAAGGVAVLVMVAFLIQQMLLWKWEGRWKEIGPLVSQLEALQQQIREYRPWFAETYRSLNVLRRLTEAFPEDGSVFARSVEIREAGTVMCRGTAESRQALLTALRQLGGFEDIAEIKVERMDGSPVEFSFQFRWLESGTP